MKTKMIKTIEKIKETYAKKTITAVLLIALLLSVGIVSASADQIGDKRTELTNIQNKIAEQKKLIDQKEGELATLKGQLDLINSQVGQLQDQLKAIEIEVDKTNLEIDNTNNQIKEKEIEIDQQKKVLGDLMVTLYKDKDQGMLEILLTSATFSDFVNQTQYLMAMESKSADTLKTIKDLKTSLENQKKDLDAKKDDLQKLQTQKQDAEAQLLGQQSFQQGLVDQTKGQESEYQKQLAAARAEEQSISAEVIRLVAEEQARQRSTVARDGRQVVNQGGFVSPLGGALQVSISGGDYMDPQYGMGFPHTGVDFRAAQGTAVYAAGDGKILIAYDSGGLGLSYVAIDHGNGIISKYLHLSAIYVATGETITKGTIIGLSGGTPGSHGAGLFTTGPHLHFELDDYSGSSINPHLYLYIAPPLF